MWNTTILMVLIATFFKVTMSIRCYTCDNEQSNTMCVGEHTMVECGTDMDTCQTIIDFSATETMSIIKTCTKNSSCFLQRLEHDDIPCDTNNKRWMCINCCHSDGCNINKASDFRSVNDILSLTAASVSVSWLCILYGR
ncbi:ly6/PLAUR domain-containing protein 2-like isoform X2 [Argopecten irradians]|uniref:ly6/PLAUR domain-containing protein 2-like isoform X2 n=1 Tax=Argopecten irradians TaxID=31199 RepID=UPI003713EB65